MPMLLGAKGKDILQWRASAELVATLKNSLTGKWGCSSSHEAEELLRNFIQALGRELDYESRLEDEIAVIIKGIEDADSPAGLHPLLVRCREAVSAHFNRRQSVLALCSVCGSIHDRIASKALSLAAQRMHELSQGAAPLHTLLCCGDRGRGEETLHSENRYLLLHEDDGSRAFLFSRQASSALKEAGLLKEDHIFWHGSVPKCQALLAASSRRGIAIGDESSPFSDGPGDLPESEWRLEAMTDLVFTDGERSMASAVIEAADARLVEERDSEAFLKLARRVFTLPLALGHFGRWRAERGGAHRGEVNLQRLGLDPLVMTVRILAAQAAASGGGTIDRINALLDRGVLSVELSERLLKAYQCLMQFRIVSEIRDGHGGAFCATEELDPDAEERLRTSLDTVLSLQKIAYQRLVGMG